MRYVDSYAVQGLSLDGSRVVFAAKAPLTPEAASVVDARGETAPQLYIRTEGTNRLVSVLPSGNADATGAAVGSGVAGLGNLENAVSEDGSRVYWTSGIGNTGNGKIHVRLHPEQGIVEGECTEPGKACTKAVSSGIGAFF